MQAEATETAEKIVSEVLVRVDALAAKLGTSAEHFWPQLVAYERAVAMGRLPVLVGLVAACALIIRRGVRHEDFGDDPWPTIPVMIASIAICFLSVGLLLNGATMIGAIFFPEAAAIKSLLGQ